MTGNWKIVVPEATTNILANPSIELGTTGCTAFGTTLSRSSDYARFGTYSIKVVTDNAGANEGFYTPYTTASASTAYTGSVYVRGSGTIIATLNYIAGGIIFASSGTITLTSEWKRYTFTGSTPVGATDIFMNVYTTAKQSTTFYVDGMQIEQKDHATTYIDGDQPGGTWAGLRHGSTSSRAANYRLGGREYDIADQYGLRVRQFIGAGVPDYELMTQDMALQPGAVYLREKINQRTLTLVMDNNSTTLAGLHSRRKAFWNVIKPDALGNSQPFLIGYNGGASGKTVYAACRYAGGWGIDGGISAPNRAIENDGNVALRLLAVDPFWYADDTETATLDYQDSLTADYGFAKIGGAWSLSGFNGNVRAIAVDDAHGRVYFGGNFTTANGVTVNGVCYWNGTNYIAMGGTPGISGGTSTGVYSLAVDSVGNVWVGGGFTSAGGSTADGLARWNYAAANWTCFTNGTPNDVIKSIVIDKNGLVYLAGFFVNWDGNANSDYIVSYNGSAFAPLSTGTNDDTTALAIGIDGTTLYVGGNFTSPQTRVMSWNGSAFAAMGSGASGYVRSLMVDNDGMVYAGGSFSTTPTTSYIASWNGSTWATLGTGTNGDVYRIFKYNSNQILVTGLFTTAGSLSVAQYAAVWNKSAWISLDIAAGGPSVILSANSYQGNIYIGAAASGTALSAGRADVTVNSTAPVYPIITITGTTTAASTSTLQWLENQTTGERLYFNLAINTGEIITIDLRPQSRKVTSNWRGQIFDQPLPTSDYSSWHLVTGSNIIAAFMTGTVTGATMTMNWQKIHASIDGEAA